MGHAYCIAFLKPQIMLSVSTQGNLACIQQAVIHHIKGGNQRFFGSVYNHPCLRRKALRSTDMTIHMHENNVLISCIDAEGPKLQQCRITFSVKVTHLSILICSQRIDISPEVAEAK